MSSLIGAARPTTIHTVDDKRNFDTQTLKVTDHVWRPEVWAVQACSTWFSGWCTESQGVQRDWVTPWWPRSGWLADNDGANHPLRGSVTHSTPRIARGCNGRLSFVGIARDVNGAPIAGATVRCFRTTNDSLQAKVTCDANGYYVATTPYSDAHYLVVHGSTGPELAGASISTLLPG